MTKLLKFLLLFILPIAFNASVFYLGYRCGQDCHSPIETIIRDTITIRDSIVIQSPQLTREITMPVPVEVDTSAILARYYTNRIYQDAIVNTPYLQVQLVDTVYQNRIIGRAASYTYRAPVVKPHAITLTAIAGRRNIDMLLGYRYKRWECMAGYDFYNQAPLFGAKYDLWAW